MVLIKVHESTYRKVIAVCDSDLIGKKLEEGKKQLDVRDNFFGGDETSEEAATRFLKEEGREDSTFNIVGDESVKIAREAGLINEEAIGHVDGVPFALVLI